MKIISFGTLKGGVGKTTVCFNVAAVLESLGKKVLIIDSDLQGNLTNNVGLDRTRPNLFTLYDVYNVDAMPAWVPEAIVYKRPNYKMPGVDMIPGSIFLHQAEMRIVSHPEKEYILRNYINNHRRFFENYDYVLIDTNPSMGLINQNAFAASEVIVLVSDVSMNAIEGGQLFIALWDEIRKPLEIPQNVGGFIVNDYDVRNRLSADFAEYLQTSPELSDIRSILLKTIIPRTVKITEAELAALPVHLYDKRSKGAIAFLELVDEMKAKGLL